MKSPSDEKFLSEDDLDWAHLSKDERDRWIEEWLTWAQATNEQDKWYYSHGVFQGCSIPIGNQSADLIGALKGKIKINGNILSTKEDPDTES